jgi:hypothetical protein
MNVQNVSVKHLLQADVYRGVPGFEQPPEPSLPPQERNWAQLLHPSGLNSDSRALIRKAYEGMTVCLNNRIGITSPSPVYPDLAAISLTSTERCYGPWLSSYETADQIGGKLEYIKDDGLAPWNYGGYTFMDQQGRLLSAFATSANIASERGGFTLASVPSGISLCQELVNAGPLVTSINVSFDAQGSAKTTYVMDSYTVSFGKLQKQKQDEIKKLSRLRKQLWDNNNKLIRERGGKSQKDIKYSLLNKQLNDKMNMIQYNANQYEQYKKSNQSKYITMSPALTTGPDASSGEGYTDPMRSTDAAIQTEQDIMAANANMAEDPLNASQAFANSAEGSFDEMYAPTSLEPHRTLPFTPPIPEQRHPGYGSIDSNTTTWKTC